MGNGEFSLQGLLNWLRFTRVLTGTQIRILAERASFGFVTFVKFIASKSHGVSPSAVEALEFVCVDGEFVGLKKVVFAGQRARLSFVGAFTIGRMGRSHLDSLQVSKLTGMREPSFSV